MPEAVNYLRVVTPEEVRKAKKSRETTRGLEEAKQLGACRICGKPINLPVDPEYPEKYEKYAGVTVGAGHDQITLCYGSEYAHTRCLIHGVPKISIDGGQLK